MTRGYKLPSSTNRVESEGSNLKIRFRARVAGRKPWLPEPLKEPTALSKPCKSNSAPLLTVKAERRDLVEGKTWFEPFHFLSFRKWIVSIYSFSSEGWPLGG